MYYTILFIKIQTTYNMSASWIFIYTASESESKGVIRSELFCWWCDLVGGPAISPNLMKHWMTPESPNGHNSYIYNWDSMSWESIRREGRKFQIICINNLSKSQLLWKSNGNRNFHWFEIQFSACILAEIHLWDKLCRPTVYICKHKILHSTQTTCTLIKRKLSYVQYHFYHQSGEKIIISFS